MPDDRRIFQLQAEICKGLAHPRRLEIIHRLGARELAFGDLRAALGVSKANLSQQLAVLRQCGIVSVRRNGVTTFYRLTYPEIATACAAVQKALTRHLRAVGRQAQALLRQVS